MKYTDVDDKIKNNKILCLLSNIGYKLNDIIDNIKIDINNDNAGVK